MFAVAVWDRSNRRLVLARDRFGIKPLYYSVKGPTLAFASELKSLLRHPGFSRALDLDALDAFLAFTFVPAPLTIFRDAAKLPPGCVLTYEHGDEGVRVDRYARPRPVLAGDARREGEAELAEELRERLRDSVRAHLVADVPVGVLLSGGIDSSLLAAFAALEGSERVKTFTIGFDERGFDERAAARLVADRYGTDHHELVVRPDAADLLPEISEAFDEPFADPSAIPTYLVSKLAREHVKVALSGEGGDELFGGYNYYVAHGLAPRLGTVAAACTPARREAADVERRREHARLEAEAFRARRPLRAARPALRVEEHPDARSPGGARVPGAPRERGSAAAPPQPLRGERGRRGARAPHGPRPRHLPRRRHAREDRPRQHGALARGAGSDSRLGRD